MGDFAYCHQNPIANFTFLARITFELPSNSMNQSQREAIIDLLILAIYSDGHLSVEEDEGLNRLIDSLGWKSMISRDLFVDSAWTRARVAAETPESAAAYVKEHAAHFTTPEDQADAYDVLHQLVSHDGIHKDEYSVLSLINGAFPAPDDD